MPAVGKPSQIKYSGAPLLGGTDTGEINPRRTTFDGTNPVAGIVSLIATDYMSLEAYCTIAGGIPGQWLGHIDVLGANTLTAGVPNYRLAYQFQVTHSIPVIVSRLPITYEYLTGILYNDIVSNMTITEFNIAWY